ncbi:hypothetical protein F3Y22_tig00109949pilonHSYRG00047 [Hibiscus syriacus]|uniref:Uncharacterized protein n=1 Tax=Hibiscus syriacus TaxID=106335 RepID=A0A6A3BVS7_HIBSY|nr:hypothetical protein F3Y22_tig00109949pilonHSYRG00047 [Hibiscus syriacus]
MLIESYESFVFSMAEEAGGGSSLDRGRGGEIIRAVGSGSMDSLESHWVFPGEDESEIEDEEDNTDMSYGARVDSEDEDSSVQRLIRTEPRVDSFNVEALEVHGTHISDYEVVLLHLYSLIYQHAKVSLLPNLVPSDTRISSFMLKVLSPELERSLKIKERLETSLTLNKLLLMLVLAGTSMVIADGLSPQQCQLCLLLVAEAFKKGLKPWRLFSIKENKHTGKCDVATIEDGKLVGDSDVGEFWSLFSGYAPISRDSALGGPQHVDSPVILYWINLQGKLSQIGSDSLDKDMLEKDKCYMLDWVLKFLSGWEEPP